MIEFWAITIIATIFLQAGIISSIRIFSVTKTLANKHEELKKENADNVDFPNILLLVPVLKEIKILERSLLRFSLMSYPAEKLKIIIVTTEKEFVDGRCFPNSVSITKKETGELNKALNKKLFSHIHYPYITGGKAEQLNYAIKKISKEFPSFFTDTTYIGVYDIDSLSPPNTLELLAKDSLKNNFPNVYQQPTLYFKNYKTFNNTVSGLISKSFAFLQTIFAITYESYNFLEQRRVIENKNSLFFKYKMMHLIGHGLFLRWEYLKHLGFFPNPIEDTRLGHVISYLGEGAHVLPVFDMSDVASGGVKLVKQSSVWFFGETMILNDLSIAKKAGHISILKQIWLSFYKVYRNIIWGVRGIVFAIFLLWMILSENFLLAAIIIVFFLYLPMATIIMMHNSMHKLSAKKFYKFKSTEILVFLFSPVTFILMSLGPLFGFLKFIQWFITKKTPHLYKTER